MYMGTMLTSWKVWLGAQFLKWTGKPRQAVALVNGFKAFCVQNTVGCVKCVLPATQGRVCRPPPAHNKNQPPVVDGVPHAATHWLSTALCVLVGLTRLNTCGMLATREVMWAPLLLSCRYARSIVSCMDHGRELEASIVPAERKDWQCVWQERPGMCWEDYSYTSLTGTAG